MQEEQSRQGFGTHIATERRPNERLNQQRLNTTDILEDIEHQLKGEIYNEEEDSWEEKGNKVIKTEEGIKSIMSFLYQFLNRNVILSELKEKKIDIIIYHLAEEVTWHLMENADTYTNNDTTNLDMIKGIVCNTAYFSMCRALNRGEAKSMAETTRQVEHFDDKNDSILPGFLQRG